MEQVSIIVQGKVNGRDCCKTAGREFQTKPTLSVNRLEKARRKRRGRGIDMSKIFKIHLKRACSPSARNLIRWGILDSIMGSRGSHLGKTPGGREGKKEERGEETLSGRRESCLLNRTVECAAPCQRTVIDTKENAVDEHQRTKREKKSGGEGLTFRLKLSWRREARSEYYIRERKDTFPLNT